MCATARATSRLWPLKLLFTDGEVNARFLTCFCCAALLPFAVSNVSAVDKTEDLEWLHQRLEATIVSQPPYSAFPDQGLSAGPVWTTENIAYTGEGCTFGWIRSFRFSSSRVTEPEIAKRFNEQFGGTKAFEVDLTRESTVESVPDAPNRLQDVDYALEEIMFRGDGLLSGGAVVEMSGLIVGDSDVRQTLVTLIAKLKAECAIDPNI